MNYEQKYKQALSRATFYSGELLTENQRKILVDIFPELKESEDELTRKSLIRFLKSPFVHENITDEKVVPWIAWLEKQDKKISADKVIGWLKSKVYDDSTYGMAMIEQFKRDFGI